MTRFKKIITIEKLIKIMSKLITLFLYEDLISEIVLEILEKLKHLRLTFL